MSSTHSQPSKPTRAQKRKAHELAARRAIPYTQALVEVLATPPAGLPLTTPAPSAASAGESVERAYSEARMLDTRWHEVEVDGVPFGVEEEIWDLATPTYHVYDPDGECLSADDAFEHFPTEDDIRGLRDARPVAEDDTPVSAEELELWANQWELMTDAAGKPLSGADAARIGEWERLCAGLGVAPTPDGLRGCWLLRERGRA